MASCPEDGESQVLLHEDLVVHGRNVCNRSVRFWGVAIGVLGLIALGASLRTSIPGSVLHGDEEQLSAENEQPPATDNAEAIWDMLLKARSAQPKVLSNLRTSLESSEGQGFLSSLMQEDEPLDLVRVQALFENASFETDRLSARQLSDGVPDSKYQYYMSKCSLTAFSMYLIFAKLIIASTTLDEACDTEDTEYFWQEKDYNPKVCAAAVSNIIDLIIWMTSFIPLVVNFCGVTSLPHSWCAGDVFWFMGNSMDVVTDSLGIATGDCADPQAVNKTNRTFTVEMVHKVTAVLKALKKKQNTLSVNDNSSSRRLSTLPAPPWMQSKDASLVDVLLRNLQGNKKSQSQAAAPPSPQPSPGAYAYMLDYGKLFGASPILKPHGSFTVEGWVKPTGEGGPLLSFSAPQQVLFAFNGQAQNSTVRNELMQIFLTKDNRIGLSAQNVSGAWEALATGTPLLKNAWTQFAFCFDANTGTSRFYRNGKMILNATKVLQDKERFSITHVPIAYVSIGGSQFWRRYFQGEVARIRVSNISRYDTNEFNVSASSVQDRYTSFLLGPDYLDLVHNKRLSTQGLVDKQKVSVHQQNYGPQAGFNALTISNDVRRVATCVFQVQSLADGLAKLGVNIWKLVTMCKALDSPKATELDQQACAAWVLDILSMMSLNAMYAAGVAASCPEEMAEHSFCAMDISNIISALLSFGEWGADITGDCSSEKTWVAKGPGSPNMLLNPGVLARA
eukprot:gb/GFBE01019444.1/.p1 GENE.gb/GFBE01019444.1/~~gb/GFBE01019444.1/.p1  ORF type:complete len:733 (+),score=135.21 gb/GFBE01019444.1/:1-2199(+)